MNRQAERSVHAVALHPTVVGQRSSRSLSMPPFLVLEHHPRRCGPCTTPELLRRLGSSSPSLVLGFGRDEENLLALRAERSACTRTVARSLACRLPCPSKRTCSRRGPSKHDAMKRSRARREIHRSSTAIGRNPQQRARFAQRRTQGSAQNLQLHVAWFQTSCVRSRAGSRCSATRSFRFGSSSTNSTP